MPAEIFVVIFKGLDIWSKSIKFYWHKLAI